MSLEEFKSKVSKLANKFELNEYKYKNQNYNEEELKTEFLNPMFKSLGWDVNNELNLAPQYKEVVFEDSIKVGDKSRAPDYCFRLGGNRIFFLEAKKPYVKIESDKSPAFQTRRYGWSAQLKCSVLSDFEHLAIYETQHKPKQSENASIGRLKLYYYRDYVEKAEEIYNLLSKEAVMKGCFDNFFDDVKIQKGTTSVDAEFLKEIDDWRLKLARNIALRNKDLSIEDLNYAVQLIIDRIIFFRMAEDRGIEKYKTLFNLLESENIYENFSKLCKKADAKYNSGLFHFHKETGNDTTLDTFTLDLAIDNSVFKEIFTNLYYPNSPYEFSVISPEILGNVYEQFLGKIIRLTPSHQAKVEEKPEVKKAGGVYYTPQYIVDYIVKNTVGELLKGKTPNKVSKIKILDPACGSGSFLLGAYTYLLDWHLEYYTNLEKPPKNVIYQAKNGDWNLTIQEKKRILLNNIYGVDIDYLAVEVTKLSLLLKVLEDTNKDLLEAQQKLIQERVLPNLGDNIKCGNSLIGTDILEEDLSLDEITKINPFDWESEFAFEGDEFGFDIVIGNPPYVNAKTLTENIPKQRSYLTKSKDYTSTYQKWDLYVPFIEKGLNLLKNNGLWAMIIPYPFINQVYGKVMREKIINDYCLLNFVDLSNEKIFSTATVTNCIPIIANKKLRNEVSISTINNKNISHVISKPIGDFATDNKNKIWDISTVKRLDKDFSKFKTFGDYCFISKGMVLNADDKKAKGKFRKKDLISDTSSDIHIKPYIDGKNLINYGINKIKYLEWDTKRVPSKISRPTFKELYTNNKLMINKLGSIKAIFDKNNIFCDQTIRIAVLWKDLVGVDNRSINNGVSRYSDYERDELEKFSSNINLGYICCILNSNFCNYVFDSIRGVGNIDINPEYLRKIPIPEISLKEQEEFNRLSNKMMDLNKQLDEVNAPQQKKLLNQQLKATNDKINKLVYELYDLTKEEIAIVEESLK